MSDLLKQSFKLLFAKQPPPPPPPANLLKLSFQNLAPALKPVTKPTSVRQSWLSRCRGKEYASISDIRRFPHIDDDQVTTIYTVTEADGSCWQVRRWSETGKWIGNACAESIRLSEAKDRGLKYRTELTDEYYAGSVFCFTLIKAAPVDKAAIAIASLSAQVAALSASHANKELATARLLASNKALSVQLSAMTSILSKMAASKKK